MRTCAFLLLFLSLPVVAAETTKDFETVQIADGIVAFIAPEPKSPLVNGNSVAVIGDDGVLVVDTGQIPSLTRRMIAEIRKRTDKPVRYVVNTHWHWDHNLANYVYREAFPGVAIVSTPFTRKAISDWTPGFLGFFKGEGALKMKEAIRKDITEGKTEQDRLAAADSVHDIEAALPELRQAVFVAPDTTFDESFTVHLGKREVRIFHPGRANTAGDAVVYVPDAKVLVTGDLVVWPTPYGTHAYFTDWIASMKKLQAMDTAAIVPGHGPVLHDKRYMMSITAMLESLVAQTQQAVRDGLSLEETRKKVDLASFRKQFTAGDWRRERFFDEYFLAPAVTDAWKQAKGEPTTESPF